MLSEGETTDDNKPMTIGQALRAAARWVDEDLIY
jgi:hypothetical protein